MKKPKFRAWHKKEKKMYKVFGITYVEHNIADDGDGIIDEWDTIKGDLTIQLDYAGTVKICSENEVDLLQFTGLKDRKGREIYEGDIVEYNHKNETVWRQVIKWKKTSIYTGYGLAKPEKYEVIGNIFENPEITT